MNHAEMIDAALRNTTPRWYDRAWVVQETLLARQVYLCYGGERVPYDDGLLHSLSTDCRSRLRRSSLAAFGASQERVRSWANIFRAAEDTRSDENQQVSFYMSIRDVIQRIRGARATDPRAQVCSALALIDKSEATRIGVDYTLTLAQVFAWATYSSMRERTDCRILGFVRF